jgi:hypothetical protein
MGDGEPEGLHGHRAWRPPSGARRGQCADRDAPIEHMAFYVGLGTLAAIEVIEWPLALLLMTGHLLMDATNRPGLHQLGEALEEA